MQSQQISKGQLHFWDIPVQMAVRGGEKHQRYPTGVYPKENNCYKTEPIIRRRNPFSTLSLQSLEQTRPKRVLLLIPRRTERQRGVFEFLISGKADLPNKTHFSRPGTPQQKQIDSQKIAIWGARVCVPQFTLVISRLQRQGLRHHRWVQTQIRP